MCGPEPAPSSKQIHEVEALNEGFRKGLAAARKHAERASRRQQELLNQVPVQKEEQP